MDGTDVLIAGAGPTGLALACDLSRRGVRVSVVERREEPSTTSRAFALHARGLEILEDLGVGHVARSATPVSAMTSHVDGRPLSRVRFRRLAHTGHPGAYLISQADIEASLRTRLEQLGGRVGFGHELIDASDEGRHVVAHVGVDGGVHDVEAAWLIGADGAHSTVRELAGISFRGGSLAETFLLADLELVGELRAHEIMAFLHADGLLGLFPLPEPGVWRLIAQTAAGDEAPDDADELIAVARGLLRTRTGRDELEVTGARWWSRFLIHRRLAASYRSDRMLLAGDAAHVHSPFGGQGMNVGLGDAGNLGWKLAMVVRGEAGVALLDSYEQERRPVAEQIVDLTTTATRLAIGEHRATRVVRDRLLPRLARIGGRRPSVTVDPPRALLERFAQLHVSYRGGPLAPDPGTVLRRVAGTWSGPQAGDRAPDAPVIVDPSGPPTTLRGIVGGGWALLRFGPPSPEQAVADELVRRHLGDGVRLVRVLPSGAGVVADRWRPPASAAAEVALEDHRGALWRAFGASSGDSVLLRPDGHVAWREGAGSLEGWLQHVCSRTPGD